MGQCVRAEYLDRYWSDSIRVEVARAAEADLPDWQGFLV